MWIEEAVKTANDLLLLFRGEDGVFSLRESDGEPLVVRPRETYDGVTPAAGSIGANALLRLGRLGRGRQLHRRCTAVGQCRRGRTASVSDCVLLPRQRCVKYRAPSDRRSSSREPVPTSSRVRKAASCRTVCSRGASGARGHCSEIVGTATPTYVALVSALRPVDTPMRSNWRSNGQNNESIQHLNPTGPVANAMSKRSGVRRKSVPRQHFAPARRRATRDGSEFVLPRARKWQRPVGWCRSRLRRARSQSVGGHRGLIAAL